MCGALCAAKRGTCDIPRRAVHSLGSALGGTLAAASTSGSHNPQPNGTYAFAATVSGSDGDLLFRAVFSAADRRTRAVVLSGHDRVPWHGTPSLKALG